MRKYLIVFAAALGLCLTSVAQADISVSVEPAGKIVNLGDTFTLDLVADIPDTDPTFGWGLDLVIDLPGVISVVGSPVLGSSWDPPAESGDGDGLAGFVFPDGIWGDDILLATVTFHADALGGTSVCPDYTIGDENEGFALDPTGFATLILNCGYVTVIPEPGTIALFMLGAAALLRRK